MALTLRVVEGISLADVDVREQRAPMVRDDDDESRGRTSLARARLAVGVVAFAALSLLAPGCDGCATRAVSDDAGNGGELRDGGDADAGFVPKQDAGSFGRDAGPADAGDDRDAGNGFDLGAFLDGGVDGLQCLPTQLPTLTVSGALDALGLGLYQGNHENGVRCGVDPRVTCGVNGPAGGDVPCCVLCGLAGCAGADDAGTVTCPAFTQAYNCDGDEDCRGSDVCCFTLQGTECRQASDCAFDVAGTLGQFLGDGGIRFPDAGVVDGGFFDGGFVQEPVDGGEIDGGAVDGGFVDVPVQGLPGPVPDAGTLLDGLQTTLDQGVPVCTSSFLGCDVLAGEACCTSDRLVAVDVGFCLPALLCLGNLLP